MTINYDYLNHNPITFPITPLPTHSHINFPQTMFGHTIDSDFTRNFIEEYGFEFLYIGKKHFVFKEDNPNGATVTLLFGGINDLTKFCFDQII